MLRSLKDWFRRSLMDPPPGPSACGTDCDGAFALVKAVALGSESACIEDVARGIWEEMFRTDPYHDAAYASLSWNQLLGRQQEGDPRAIARIIRIRAAARAAVEATIWHVRSGCQKD